MLYCKLSIYKYLKKTISLIIVISFLALDIVGAFPASNSTPKQVSSIQSLESIIQNPSELNIPYEFVSLKEFYKGSNGKLIIHIQDAHANLSGQKNLAGAMRVMMQQYDIGTILTEGGSGDVTLDAVRKITDQKTWQLIANQFLYQSIITGAEYLNLTSERPMKIIGIEDENLYEDNLKAYASLMQQRKDNLKYIHRIQIALNRLKNKLYPKKIVHFEDNRKKATQTDAPYLNNLSDLMYLANEADTDMSQYPEVVQLNDLKAIEANIDFEQANREQSALLSILSNRGASKEARDLIKSFKESKSSQLTQFNLMNQLFELADQRDAPLIQYSNLAKYREYLREFSNLQMGSLLQALEELEDDMYRDLLPNEDSKKVRAIDRYLGLLKKAYLIQLSSNEFEMRAVNEPVFKTSLWQGFMNQKSIQLGLEDNNIEYQPYFENAEVDLKEFYALVDKRDFAFIKNTKKVVNQENIDAAFLISGGYHTEHLTKLFRNDGYSYVVLTPNIKNETNHAMYEKILLEPLTIVQSESKEKANPNTILSNLSQTVFASKLSQARRNRAVRMVKKYGLSNALSNAVRMASQERGQIPSGQADARMTDRIDFGSEDEMLSFLMKTAREQGKEHYGSIVLSADGSVAIEEMREGYESSARSLGKEIEFHTHPRVSEAIPSLEDIAVFIQNTKITTMYIAAKESVIVLKKSNTELLSKIALWFVDGFDLYYDRIGPVARADGTVLSVVPVEQRDDPAFRDPRSIRWSGFLNKLFSMITRNTNTDLEIPREWLGALGIETRFLDSQSPEINRPISEEEHPFIKFIKAEPLDQVVNQIQSTTPFGAATFKRVVPGAYERSFLLPQLDLLVRNISTKFNAEEDTEIRGIASSLLILADKILSAEEFEVFRSRYFPLAEKILQIGDRDALWETLQSISPSIIELLSVIEGGQGSEFMITLIDRMSRMSNDLTAQLPDDDQGETPVSVYPSFDEGEFRESVLYVKDLIDNRKKFIDGFVKGFGELKTPGVTTSLWSLQTGWRDGPPELISSGFDGVLRGSASPAYEITRELWGNLVAPEEETEEVITRAAEAILDADIFYMLTLLKLYGDKTSGSKEFEKEILGVNTSSRVMLRLNNLFKGREEFELKIKFSSTAIIESSFDKDEERLVRRQVEAIGDIDQNRSDSKQRQIDLIIKRAIRLSRHVRSIRLLSTEAEPIYEPATDLAGAKFNGVDYALLVVYLRRLLDAYAQELKDPTSDELRSKLVSAIFIALAADPEVLLNPTILGSLHSATGTLSPADIQAFPKDVQQDLDTYSQLLEGNIDQLLTDIKGAQFSSLLSDMRTSGRILASAETIGSIVEAKSIVYKIFHPGAKDIDLFQAYDALETRPDEPASFQPWLRELGLRGTPNSSPINRPELAELIYQATLRHMESRLRDTDDETVDQKPIVPRMTERGESVKSGDKKEIDGLDSGDEVVLSIAGQLFRMWNEDGGVRFQRDGSKRDPLDIEAGSIQSYTLGGLHINLKINADNTVSITNAGDRSIRVIVQQRIQSIRGDSLLPYVDFDMAALVGQNMGKAFDELNQESGYDTLEVIDIRNEFAISQGDLVSRLNKIEGDPFVIVRLVQEVDDVSAKPRFDYKLVVDRKSRIQERVDALWRGKIMLEEYEYELNFTYIPQKRTVYVDNFSKGRLHGEYLSKKGLADESFGNMAEEMSRIFPGAIIATAAVEDRLVADPLKRFVPRYMKAYFNASLANESERESVTSLVYIDPPDRFSIYIGIVPKKVKQPVIANVPGGRMTERGDEGARMVPLLGKEILEEITNPEVRTVLESINHDEWDAILDVYIVSLINEWDELRVKAEIDYRGGYDRPPEWSDLKEMEGLVSVFLGRGGVFDERSLVTFEFDDNFVRWDFSGGSVPASGMIYSPKSSGVQVVWRGIDFTKNPPTRVLTQKKNIEQVRGMLENSPLSDVEIVSIDDGYIPEKTHLYHSIRDRYLKRVFEDGQIINFAEDLFRGDLKKYLQSIQSEKRHTLLKDEALLDSTVRAIALLAHRLDAYKERGPSEAPLQSKSHNTQIPPDDLKGLRMTKREELRSLLNHKLSILGRLLVNGYATLEGLWSIESKVEAGSDVGILVPDNSFQAPSQRIVLPTQGHEFRRDSQAARGILSRFDEQNAKPLMEHFWGIDASAISPALYAELIALQTKLKLGNVFLSLEGVDGLTLDTPDVPDLSIINIARSSFSKSLRRGQGGVLIANEGLPNIALFSLLLASIVNTDFRNNSDRQKFADDFGLAFRQIFKTNINPELIKQLENISNLEEALEILQQYVVPALTVSELVEAIRLTNAQIEWSA